MGLFSVTCSLSGLPIDDEDRVVALLLERNAFAATTDGNVLEHTGYWIPVTPPVRGVYNGYGSIASVPDDEARACWAMHKNQFFDRLPSDCCGPPATFDDLLAKVRLSGKIRLALIREDVWQHFLLLKRNYLYDGDGPDPFAAFVERITSGDFIEVSLRFGAEPYGQLGPGIRDCVALMMKTSKDASSLNAFRQSLLEFSFVDNTLRGLGRAWHPAEPLGPQVGEWLLHAELAKGIAKIAAAQAKKHKA